MSSITELIYQIQEASNIYKEIDNELLSSIMSSIEEARKKTHNNYNLSSIEIAIIYMHEKFGLPISISNIFRLSSNKIIKFIRKYRKEDIEEIEERLNTFLLNGKSKEFKEEYLKALKILRNSTSHHPLLYVQITLYNLLMKKREKNFIFKNHRYGISEVTSRRIQDYIKKVLLWT
jgi:hypothetical protein